MSARAKSGERVLEEVDWWVDLCRRQGLPLGAWVPVYREVAAHWRPGSTVLNEKASNTLVGRVMRLKEAP